jgi:sn-glycerol 3-phosphate transport system ATP-binding protein
MRDDIRTLQQKLGLTMVYVTHDQVEAMTMADQVVLLKAGRVVQTGRPHDLYERPRTTFAAQFMGSPPMNLLKIDLIEKRSVLADACGGFLTEDSFSGGFIGVRPEHVQVAPTGLPVTLSAADYLGAETVLRLTHGQQPCLPRSTGITDINPVNSCMSAGRNGRFIALAPMASGSVFRNGPRPDQLLSRPPFAAGDLSNPIPKEEENHV